MADKFDFDQFEDAPETTQQVSQEFESFDFDQFKDALDQGPSTAEAAITGAGQGLTFGLSDELSGIQGAAMEAIAGEDRLPAESRTDYLQRLYSEYRDAARARQERAAEAQPEAYTAADVAAGFLVPGGALAKAGKVGFKQAAKAGAALGGLEAAGRTEEDLTTLSGVGDVALGAAGGGLLGGVGGAIGKKFTREAVEKAQKEATKEANLSALKSIGAKAKDLKEEFGFKTNKRATLDTAKGTGKTLLEEDIIKPVQSIDEVKEQIVSKLDEVAKNRIEPLGKRADELANEMGVRDFANELNVFAQKTVDDLDSLSGATPYAKGENVKVFENIINTSEKVGDDVQKALNTENPISKLVNIKRNLQKEVNWNDPQSSVYNEYLVKAQSNVTDLINNMTQKLSPELSQEMQKANQTYGNLIRANKIAGDETARQLVRDPGIGFTDYLASGVISGVTRTPLLGPAVVGSKKGIEKVTGKDLGDLMQTYSALTSAQKAQKLNQRLATESAETMQRRAERPGRVASGVTTGTAAAIDDQDSKPTYEKNKEMATYIKQATSDSIRKVSQSIMREYGKDAELLSRSLDRIAEAPASSRQAMMFSILQDPNNRRMLGINQTEE